MTRTRTSILWASVGSAILLAALLPSTIATPNNAYAFHTFGGSYAIDIIPGAAQQDSLYHYYPPKIAVPEHTEVVWFNGDPSQPHTVTSGLPGDENIGDMFNSGIMSYQYFFQYEFNVPGDYPYHCIIHPWRTGTVHVGDFFEQGNNFHFSHGTDGIWSLSQFERNLLKFEPTTVALEETTPASYYFTMYNTDTSQTVYSGYFPSTNNIQIELISSDYNETSTYGPDRASTIHSNPGAFHVRSNLFEPGSYLVSVAVTAVNGQPLQAPSADQYELEIAE
jgi:plastocyanin